MALGPGQYTPLTSSDTWPESTHLICNPAGGHQLIKNVTRQTTRIGGYVGESEVTMGIFSSGASAIPASITGDEAGHLGRVLFQHRIQPQICDSVAERSTPREEAAVREEIVITRHGRPAGVLIGFESEDDWFDYRIENHPDFLRQIAEARSFLQRGLGIRLEDLDPGQPNKAVPPPSRRPR